MLPATSTLCGIFSLLIAGSPIFYSPAPRGVCSNCCAIREREDIKFLLYTNKNPQKSQNLYLADERRLAKSNFDLQQPLAFYLHGFSESAIGDNQSSQQLKDAFLKSGNYNVILVDWSPMTALPWYTNAVENLPVAARFIARFLRFLVASGYQTRLIHVIGFSLGAEVAGFVGKQLLEWGVVLPRITGLDPPLPLFEVDSGNRHLTHTDARFVDIIHTDGGILGNPEEMGHADFYPNGGRPLQPGCARQEIANNRWLGILIGCSHQRAWEYFVESINRPYAFPVDSCEPTEQFGRCKDGNGRAFMGIAADQRLRGKFFLETNDKPPYGRDAEATAPTSPSEIATTSEAVAALPMLPAVEKINGTRGHDSNTLRRTRHTKAATRISTVAKAPTPTAARAAKTIKRETTATTKARTTRTKAI
ncbi:pancreatic lipase-related protein 2 [Anastrepha ludens]|uniref:pancreatic lipase-related protein 2 n=1 Tax=Anastrepha ludens TaxID=28586 RepID=UPI0023AEF7F8|nr:pancreatic lipase-related protein 2 [Anastrepha ludens]XP_053962050.1 pancreatic lipase-related protein 2 [Anastrepha ludens]XP_053962051.1 pancreatic lipase-related protein 2 [Anastrepha ludens]XP_053962052.1 pancreatic lipase-related protein 2 [Anastrepha ludens]XP_053962053.1 pancreatic lipase-related protein 2 [Anastrepha ludens]XP_053962054.1 pancreatic lipase-related protein 2 [Anastrepha ludens]